jgi:predicted ABC-type ATPase
VPRGKIIKRRERSLQQLPWFLANADLAWIFDNSGAQPVAIARKHGKTIVVDACAMLEIRDAAQRAKNAQ